MNAIPVKQETTKERLMRKRDERMIRRKIKMEKIKESQKPVKKPKRRNFKTIEKRLKKDKNKIDLEIRNIKEHIGNVKIEEGRDREKMKNHLRKEFFRNKSEA